MAGTPRINWFAARSYYATRDPWYPGQLGEFGLYRRSPLVEALLPRSRRRTYANVGRAFGVSRQAVQQHAKRNGWAEYVRGLEREAARRKRQRSTIRP